MAGIPFSSIDADTLAVTSRPNLFACGEALDQDADCGGYNLGWAWLSGLRAGEAATWDVVGPVCESGDWLGRDRQLDVRAGDLLAVMSAGAYCMSMASNYNSRCRAAEVLVADGAAHLIADREKLSDILARERLL